MNKGRSVSAESDWETYRILAPAAVPSRAEQIATLLTLLPFGPEEAFKIADLGAGEGFLSLAALDAFPNASVLALDGSQEMLTRAAHRFGSHGTRARTRFFELGYEDWLPLIENTDVVMSSLCLHHLDGAGKQRLFRALRSRLGPRGAVLIADIVAPGQPRAERLFADTWDESARRQSMAATGSRALFDLFLETEWNVYRHPDPMDTPSPLFDQLKWLEGAGFTGVDCFWMQSGHAIYGGYAGPDERATDGVAFGSALSAAEAALQS